jgi:hypothetical protein
MCLGWNRLAPVSLSNLGMPGCFQDISLDAAVFLSGSGGSAVYELPIPDWHGLVGMHFFNQAVILDIGSNALGAVASAAAEGIIGYQ